ncbi:MAG: D-alanyl-D-alanine carboxypeptidase family protein [Phormidesmis sp.]
MSPSNRFSDDSSSGDIPPARRQPTEIPLHEIEKASARPVPKQRSRGRVFLLLLLLTGATGIGLWQWNRISPNAPALVGLKQTWTKAVSAAGLDPASTSEASSLPDETQPSESPSSALATTAPTTADPTAAPAPLSTTPSSNPGEPSLKEDTLLNHRRYDEAPPEELVALNANSLLKLQPEAQQAVNAMLAKAKAEGVQLGVISAFRTVADQNHLYFDIKAERGQSAKTRAEVSAPPGYSEHHTGYAVDFIDEGRPDTQLSQTFEETLAYQWLDKNAAFFNFELSFPKEASSGVSYEPWHWRFVGNQKSLELFYKE